MTSNTVLVSVPAGRGAAFVARARSSGPRPGRAHPGGADPGLLRRPGHLPRRVALLGRVRHPQRQRPEPRAHRRPLHGLGPHLDGPRAARRSARSPREAPPATTTAAIWVSNPASLNHAAGCSTTAPSVASPGRAGSVGRRLQDQVDDGHDLGTVRAYASPELRRGHRLGLTGPDLHRAGQQRRRRLRRQPGPGHHLRRHHRRRQRPAFRFFQRPTRR